MEDTTIKEALAKYSKDLKDVQERLTQNRQGQSTLRQQEAGLVKASDQINGAIFALNELTAPEAPAEGEEKTTKEESDDAKEDTAGA